MCRPAGSRRSSPWLTRHEHPPPPAATAGACRDEGVPSRQQLRGRLLDDDATEALLERDEQPVPHRFTREYELEQHNLRHLESLTDEELAGHLSSPDEQG